jgi:hypothetical protein
MTDCIVLEVHDNSENNAVGEISSLPQNTPDVVPVVTDEAIMKTPVLLLCLAACSLSLEVRAGDERQYADGPVTNVTYIHVDYGSFEKYVDWLNSTWKPTMEATKKAGLIIDYKAYGITPMGYAPNQPNMILAITYKNLAALDKEAEQEDVARKVIGSTEFQNKARIGRNDFREVLGSELIRELILK